MSTSAQAPTRETPETNTDYYRRVLHELIDMGTDLARHIHTQATSKPATQQPLQDPTIPFDRIARTVRRTVLLAQQLDRPPTTRLHRDATRIAARRRIIRAVEDAIQRPFEDPAKVRTRQAEFRERLDAPELNDELVDELAARPIADIIEDICNDLGLGNMPSVRPHKLRTPQQVLALRALAAAPQPTAHPNPPDRWRPEPA